MNTDILVDNLRNQRNLRAKYSCHADDADDADFLLIISEITLLSLKRHNKVVCSSQLRLFVAVRTHKNQDKPLALDASLIRAIDGAAVWKSLSKLRYFQPAIPSPYGFRINRKAINRK